MSRLFALSCSVPRLNFQNLKKFKKLRYRHEKYFYLKIENQGLVTEVTFKIFSTMKFLYTTKYSVILLGLKLEIFSIFNMIVYNIN